MRRFFYLFVSAVAMKPFNFGRRMRSTSGAFGDGERLEYAVSYKSVVQMTDVAEVIIATSSKDYKGQQAFSGRCARQDLSVLPLVFSI